jgi:hypothetical protein
MIDRTTEYVQLFANTRKNAGRRAIEFSVTQGQFLLMVEKQDGICAVTGMEFDFRPTAGGKKRPFFPSIDRIDSTKGYSAKNIRLVVTIANYAMNEWGAEPLFEMVDTIVQLRAAKADRDRKEQELLDVLPSLAETKERYLGRQEAADYINSLGFQLTKGTLQKFATTGGGPIYRKFGKRAVYLVSDLNAWVADKLSKPIASTSGLYAR